METDSLKGKTAVITGGGRGLGKTMALALAEAGVNLALVGRGADSLRAVAEEAQKFGATAEFYIADVTKEKEVLELEQQVISQFARVHILINNAGINIRKNVTDFTYEEWTSVLNTN